MSRARELAKMGGSTQVISGVSTFVGIATFASDVDMFSNLSVTGDLNVTGDLSYDETTATNSRITGVSTTTDLIVTQNANVAGIVTAASFVGDGSGITNAGSTLSAGSGSQRIVLTSQTTGAMTATATDSGLIYESGADALTVSGGLSVGAAATVGGNLTVTGNLTVDGTTTTVNSTTLTVDDKNIELGSVATPSDTTANGGGITLKGASDHTLIWYNDNDHWESSEHFNLVSGKEYQIADASVLSATTLGSGVTSSSLTSVGTLASLTVSGTITANGSVDLGNATSDTLTITARVDSDIVPSTNNARALGTDSLRWSNIYSNDLDLSNEGSVNDFDGTWGSYLIQEGEEDLFILNRRNGKKYKFVLQEV